MRYSIIATISIDAKDETAAKAAARQLYDGIWDLMPELPQPNPVTVVMFNGKDWVTKIDSRRKR